MSFFKSDHQRVIDETQRNWEISKSQVGRFETITANPCNKINNPLNMGFGIFILRIVKFIKESNPFGEYQAVISLTFLNNPAF